jgi:hypothetical protein
MPAEAETRPHDWQALERHVSLKQRDGGVDHVLLVLGDTRHNRHLVRLAGPALLEHFPVPSHEALRALAAGSSPRGSAIVFL